MKHRSVIVIGAGLAGLTAARDLTASGHDVAILEARHRVGGRALSLPVKQGGVDLGPAWIWPDSQPKVCALINELGLKTLHQFEEGLFVYETARGIQRGSFPRRYEDTARIRGGVAALADALALALPTDTVQHNQVVSGLDLTGTPRITTENGIIWSCDAVICAAPPPIAARWDVTPDWTEPLQNAMTRWPTWMAAHAKVVAVYDRPFWREAGLSGSAVSQVGPLVEVADQSDPDMEQFALFGFVGWPFANRQDKATLRDAALAQLERLFGPQAPAPIQLEIMDWAAEQFTTTKADQIPAAGHPPYGAPELSQPVNSRLFFAGAEVSQTNGGLIEGAIETGLKAAQMAKAALAKPACAFPLKPL